MKFIFATNSNSSSIFIGASNTSNYVSIAPGDTTVNNDLSLAGKLKLPIGGTVSNPSLFWSGESNTGIYRVAANQVGVATNGTNALTISSSNAAFASQITSRAAQGTAPLVVTSTTLVSKGSGSPKPGSPVTPKVRSPVTPEVRSPVKPESEIPGH